jgi:xylan 1,4-beta-xylosidase
LEIHWTEWNSISSKDASSIAWTNNPQVDSLFAASFIVRNSIELDKTVNTLDYWCASDIFDESGIINSPFSGSYGLLTLEGLPKASCNAFRLLNKMRGELFTAQPDSPLAPGRGLCVTKEADTWHIIAWNQNFVEQPTQTDWLGRLQLPAPLEKPHLAISATIGPGGGSPWESWQAMGCPQTLSPGQFEFLQAQSQPDCQMLKLTPDGKTLSVPFCLKPNEVKYLEIQASPASAVPKKPSQSELEQWQKVLGNQAR